MGPIKLFLLVLLSSVASLLISRTVGRSLEFRGLEPKRVALYKFITFLVAFVTLTLLGLLA